MATSIEDIIQVADGIFSSYDKDDSGFIDRAELKTIMTELFKQVKTTLIVTDQKINQTFSNLDKNSDDKLSRKEFRQLVRLYFEYDGKEDKI